MTIGGLYVIDAIDVVASLVPEEDVAVCGNRNLQHRNIVVGRTARINCSCGLCQGDGGHCENR